MHVTESRDKWVLSEKSKKLLSSFQCPVCLAKVILPTQGEILCAQCGRIGEVSERISIDQRNIGPLNENIDSGLDNLKSTIKRAAPRFYSWLIRFCSPVYVSKDPLKFLPVQDWSKELVLNLGSGATRLHPEIVNVDISSYSEVDLVCSIEALPLFNDSVDALFNIAVLEHVPRPQRVVDEMFRVLRPGGRVYCFIPFMQGIHASPDDYQRLTPSGIKELFKGFKLDSIEVDGGPFSALAWILQEWFSITFSFGSVTLYWILYTVSFVITPIKYLDSFFSMHPMASKIASGFSFVAQKPERAPR